MRPLARLVFMAAFVVDLFAVGVNISLGRGWGVVINLLAIVVVVAIWWHAERRTRRIRRDVKQYVDELYAPRPEGVRIRRADGTEQPVELIYLGDDDGYHLWEVAGMVLQPGDEIIADVMPGRTGIEFQSSHPAEGD